MRSGPNSHVFNHHLIMTPGGCHTLTGATSQYILRQNRWFARKYEQLQEGVLVVMLEQ